MSACHLDVAQTLSYHEVVRVVQKLQDQDQEARLQRNLTKSHGGYMLLHFLVAKLLPTYLVCMLVRGLIDALTISHICNQNIGRVGAKCGNRADGMRGYGSREPGSTVVFK